MAKNKQLIKKLTQPNDYNKSKQVAWNGNPDDHQPTNQVRKGELNP